MTRPLIMGEVIFSPAQTPVKRSLRPIGGSLELNSGPPRVILRRAAPATVLPVYPQQRKSLRNAGTAGQRPKQSSGRGHRDGSTHGASWRTPYCEEVAGSGGRVNRRTAPLGTLVVAHTRPPCASIIERQTHSPMPMPPGFVV